MVLLLFTLISARHLTLCYKASCLPGNSHHGVNGNFLQWLRNFFTGRTHRTKVGSSLSDQVDLVSRIVQGSGIGPIIFIIFINELVIETLEVHGIRFKFFTDDLKMYAKIMDNSDVVRLQVALDTLTQWAVEWQLLISIDKCRVLNIGKVCVDTCSHINSNVFPIVISHVVT